MTRVSSIVQQAAILAALVAQAGVTQPAPQFKANVRMKNGSDGTTSTGTMYFSGAKMRTELTSDGQNIVVLADPAAKSQFVLMPSEKMYMQMAIGQGPVSIPITGPSDPTNPCSAGSGNTDCVKGSNESVNGYDAVRWDYTSAEGVRTRAWVSMKLRFSVKSQDDNGSSMEFTNIAEGPQPATLFAVPAGYTKMDMGAMGGMGMANPGRGRGGARGNPMAGMPGAANLPPEMAAAMAAAMRGESGPAGQTGSAWEKGKGWILTVTVAGTASEDSKSAVSTDHKTYSAKATGSLPLNHGTPSIGVPGAPGPTWTLLPTADVGTREANAVPTSLSMQTESRVDRSWTGACNSGAPTEPGTSVETMKTTTQKSVPSIPMSAELIGQGMFKISPDLKTYDLLVGVGSIRVNETTLVHTETKDCRSGAIHKEDKTQSTTADYGVPTIDLKGLPLPATVSTVTGSKKMPLRLGGRQVDATVTWTIAPIK